MILGSLSRSLSNDSDGRRKYDIKYLRVLEYILRVAGLLHVSMKLRYAIVGIGAVCPDES